MVMVTRIFGQWALLLNIYIFVVCKITLSQSHSTTITSSIQSELSASVKGDIENTDPNSSDRRSIPRRSEASLDILPSEQENSMSCSLLVNYSVNSVKAVVKNVSHQENASLASNLTLQLNSEPHPSFEIPVPSRNNSILTLGYLVTDALTGLPQHRTWRLVSGAFTYAIDTINQQGRIPGYNLTYVIRDTRRQTNDSLLEMSKLWRDGIVGFIGPALSCTAEALLASAWNLPMLSHHCPDDAVSDKNKYPTFARTFPPVQSITMSVISLLKHYNWTKFAIFYGDADLYKPQALKLKQLAHEHNMNITHFKYFKEPYIALTIGNPFPDLVQHTYVDARIYVFIGSLNALVDFMINLNLRGLLDTGEYEVIYVEAVDSIGMEPDKYFKSTYENKDGGLPNERGAQSLLVVYPTPQKKEADFQNAVRRYNGLPPLNFSSYPSWKKQIRMEATYLYDTLMLYADALRDVLENNGSYLDGRSIISKILGRTYTSIQGYLAKIDVNGSGEGNYTVLSHQTCVLGNISMPTMLPVANFLVNEKGELPIFNLYADTSIKWVGGKPPVAEPPCGFRGELCMEPDNYLKEIAVGVFGGVVSIGLTISLMVYRNWRYEQEIAGLLWKIDISAIQFAEIGTGRFDKRMVSDGNHNPAPCWAEEFLDFLGISMVSMESRNSYAQVYTYVGKYKGQTVALKTYNIRSSDLTRKDKMEMKMMRDLRHTNVNSFIGACLQSSVLTLVTAYCVKGSLQDVLENDDIKLDQTFMASLIKDIIQGMMYIHNSDLIYHGNLKSSNCVVTSRWTLQVADNGLLDIRNLSKCKDDHYAYYRHLLWKAPEILRSGGKIKGSQPGDVYAFSIILHEIYGRAGPYGNIDLDPQDIVNKIMGSAETDQRPFRPDTSSLTCDVYVTDLMTSCWAQLPEDRPDFHAVWNRLKPMRVGMKRNIFDHMLAMMEKYQEHLEELVDERTEQLSEEKKKTETLLYRMLPQSVADHLKKGEAVVPEAFDCVTIYFSDICGFTSLSAESTPMQIVDMLNDLYTCFDSIIKNFDVYKVETIGDAYMVVSGLPIRNGNCHAAEVASMSLTLLSAIKSFTIRHKPQDTLKLRIGIHSGPCVAGVVGLTMPRYTLFGDTVNTASRMESNGEALKIHCSSQCKTILDTIGGFCLEVRGYVAMKGKGTQLTYWLLREDKSKSQEPLTLQLDRSLHSLHASSRELMSPSLLDKTDRPKSSHYGDQQPEHQTSSAFPHVSSHQHHSFSNHKSNNSLNVLKYRDASKAGSFPEGINGMQRQYLSPALKERSFRSSKTPATIDITLPRRTNSNKRQREQSDSHSDNISSTTPTEVTTLLMDYFPSSAVNITSPV